MARNKVSDAPTGVEIVSAVVTALAENGGSFKREELPIDEDEDVGSSTVSTHLNAYVRLGILKRQSRGHYSAGVPVEYMSRVINGGENDD